MHRDEVLAHHRHRANPRQHGPAGESTLTSTRPVRAAQMAEHPLCQQIRQPRMGHRHRESTEQRIGERDFRPGTQAFLEGHHGPLQAHPAE